MPESKKELANKLMRDIVLIDEHRYPDWMAAGRDWAKKLGASHPYNVVHFRPGEDLSTFGAKLTEADHAKLEAQGALLLRPMVQGRA
ncbi:MULTISPECIES: hypothetical protein [unclassified Bradyrhizobium]|uniref:hypothetical protein n=1 Tax=unclassified Bradyrhizobium TaxID=2631580 RepID=UPI00070EF09F|nr:MULTISPECIES: hypothetical protein [unclassified Bradyrhizobium]KQT09259.1 hypothetical protein ASG57_35495 [Bradyrhizobium sp. Leaf396]